MNEIVIGIIKSLLFLIPEVFIIVSCFYFLSKKTSVEGILLLIGSLLAAMLTIFQMEISLYMLQKDIIEMFKKIMFIHTITRIISFCSSMIFSIGFFLLIFRIVKKKNLDLTNNIPDNI
jgi:hypothetical protein